MAEFDLNVRTLIRFFDEKPPDSERHATALNAVFGEDVGIGLLCHYLVSVSGARVARVLLEANGLPEIPSIPKGPRLDRWVLWDSDVTRTLLQTEIKNWSAHSAGGRKLSLDAPESQRSAFRRERWQRFWHSESGRFKDDEVQKVLSAMPAPGYEYDGSSYKRIEPAPDKVEPAVLFWFCIHPTGEPTALFPFELPSTRGYPFSRVWCFSASEYLRQIMAGGDDRVRLYLPETGPRMAWLGRILSPPAGG